MQTRNFQSFTIADFSKVKFQMLNWCSRFNICAFLDNHLYHSPDHQYEIIAGCGAAASIQLNSGNALQKLNDFITQQNDWCFGHLGYGLMQETEGILSKHISSSFFSDLGFFVPEILLLLSSDKLTIGSLNREPHSIFQEIIEQKGKDVLSPAVLSKVDISCAVDEQSYLETIRQLKSHIARGDCYEINYCIPFFAQEVRLNPVAVYQKLTALSPNPFAAYYKWSGQYLFCGSPERFLSKRGQRLLSQPMKGTIARNPEDPDLDFEQKKKLSESNKDKSENVMVVDLVRNDLSKICSEGSVQTDELFQVYSFPHVHQMISSVSGELRSNTSFAAIIKALFPMGSMTGAPKKRVVELIDQYETVSRGLFSGSVGYISPNGDFDFNVVIRSLFYDENTRKISFYAGSGITYLSDPTEEFRECLLKANAILRVLKAEE